METGKYFELNGIEYTTCQNLYNAAKDQAQREIYRPKYMYQRKTTTTAITKTERLKIHDLNIYFKRLEMFSKLNPKKENIKQQRAVFDGDKHKLMVQRINKTNSLFFQRLIKFINFWQD